MVHVVVVDVHVPSAEIIDFGNLPHPPVLSSESPFLDILHGTRRNPLNVEETTATVG